MYTTKDLVFSKSKKTCRSWNYKGGCNACNSDWESTKKVTFDVATSDGNFKSFTDSDGYSYWQDNQITYGNKGTDYFFLCDNFPSDEGYQQRVVDLLNRLAF